ncbi:MAG: hypothetical protein RSC93_01515 [Erysipelotrichaceae bacterium]
MKIYMIEFNDTETGKKCYAKAGTRYQNNVSPINSYQFSKHGKAWSSRGGLSGHLALDGNVNYYKKYGCVILEIDTDLNTMERLSIDEYKAS